MTRRPAPVDFAARLHAEAAYAVRCRVDALPASVNALYRQAGRGRKVLSDAAVLFRDLVALAVRGEPPPPAGEPLELSIWLTFPDGRTRDGDNFVKNATDSLAAALGFNDTRIVAWHIYVERGAVAETELLLEVRG